jgi:hypothetical protein
MVVIGAVNVLRAPLRRPFCTIKAAHAATGSSACLLGNGSLL